MKMLDLFSGIGGFHKGFQRAGFIFDWVGFSEIDKYASAVYKHKFKEAEELGDITTIQPERDLPDHIDLICGGFPCQAFSVAGKRKGFDDTRGTLFFEIARILRYYRDVGKPISCFLLENVKGLLSHDNGRTFATIYRVLDNLGYTIEFQLLNTRWWLPQNRERIYIVGYIGDGSGSKVFPIGAPSKISNNRNTKVANTLQHPGHSGGNYRGMTIIAEATKKVQLKQVGTIGKDSMGSRVYSDDGISCALRANGGGLGAKTGLYQVDTLERNQDSYDFNSRVYSDKGIAKTLAGDGGNNDNKTGLYQVHPVLTPNRAEKQQNGRRFKEDGEDMFTLTQQDQHGVMIKSIRSAGNKDGSRYYYEDDVTQTIAANPTSDNLPMVNNPSIRRLTPKECERLQGFPDNWTSKGIIDGKVVDMSDTQRYKQCGNAVTVDVVQAVAERLILIFNKN